MGANYKSYSFNLGATALAVMVLNDYSFSISKLLDEASNVHPEKN